MNKKNRQIQVEGKEINIQTIGKDDFISLTDMLKAKDGSFFISDWLRNRNTLEYLEAWESINNPNFNYGEFATIKSFSGLNSFKISVKEWIEKTNAIGIVSSAGRYGGTYAHKDLAFHFGMWISPKFQLYIVNEYQRLKDDENDRLKLNWNLNRTLAKINYRNTDAIKENLTPQHLKKEQINNIYANETDVLNVALFGKTAKQWRDENLELDGNIRDYATIEQLLVLANLESLNAEFIKMNLAQSERLLKLNETAISQMKALAQNPNIKKLK